MRIASSWQVGRARDCCSPAVRSRLGKHAHVRPAAAPARRTLGEHGDAVATLLAEKVGGLRLSPAFVSERLQVVGNQLTVTYVHSFLVERPKVSPGYAKRGPLLIFSKLSL